MKSIYLSLILFLSVTVCFGQVDNIPDSSSELSEDPVYEKVDVEAWYKGGLSSLRQFMSSKIEYPEKAIENKTQGNIIIKFVIEIDGSISNVTILKDIGDGCGEEWARVIKLTSGKWKPALIEDQPVRSYYVFPVTFKLPQEDPEPTDTPE